MNLVKHHISTRVVQEGIPISITGGDRPFGNRVDDILVTWPNFFPPGVRRPSAVTAVEHRAPDGVHWEDSPETRRWLSTILRRATGTTEHMYEVMLEGRAQSDVLRRRGFWALHPDEFEYGTQLTESACNIDGALLMGGVLKLGSVGDVVNSMTRPVRGIWGAYVFSRDELNVAELLNALLVSPHTAHFEFVSWYFIPELISEVVPQNGLVLRLWEEDEFVLDVFGSPELLPPVVGP